MKNCLIIVLFLGLCSACTPPEENRDQSLEWTNIPLKYATGFTIEKAGNTYRVVVGRAYKEAQKSFTYIFKPHKVSMDSIPADAIISTPVKSVVCTSTTHIPLLDYLDETNSLVGFPTLDYISSSKMRQRINSGKVSELGIDEAINLEKIIEMQPDILMGYSLSGDLGQFQMIEETGIPVVLNAEYLEPHPLGRAEWIKFAGIMFNKLDKADSAFNIIEEEYLEIAAQVKDIKEQPTTLSGVVYGDSWYLPGGRNYASTLLKDAGYRFFWENDTSSAFVPLSFEKVFDEAYQAEFWIGVASYKSLEEISAGDQRYTSFKAFKNGNVYSYNKRIGEKGGSEFLELGYLRPDFILKDLVKIGHPELLPEHDLFFHFRLP